MCSIINSRLNNQQGAVMVLVLILLLVLTVFATAAYEVAINNQKMLIAAAGSDAALYNAEQGVHKYLWEFNNDPLFFDNDDLYMEIDSNSERKIFQKDGDEEGNYRVQVIIPLKDATLVNNRAYIRSTGWDENYPERMRTIEVELLRRTFTQYGMVTNTDINGNEAVYWVDGEKFYGPLHTNDTLYVGSYNPVFYGPVTYANGIVISPDLRIADYQVFRQGNSRVDPLVFPPSNDKLMALARVGGAGHYYNGRACIMLKGDSYDIRYWDNDDNTWKYNGRPYTYTSSGNNNNRYDEVGTYRLTDTGATYGSFAALRAAVPSLPLPENRVIFVNGYTGDGGNGGRTYEFKFDPRYGNVFVSGELDGELTIAAANDIYITGYDPVDWRRPNKQDSWGQPESLWVPRGSYTGGLTYTTTSFTQKMDGGDWLETVVSGDGDDMLGLVAARRIEILHYNWPSQEAGNRYNWHDTDWWGDPVRIDVAPYDIHIQAALYVKDLSYGFEHPRVGNGKGTIYLVGSITQNVRGIVGDTGGHGYDKNYSHDPRMLYTSPPHYIEPSNTGWQAMQWREISDHITSTP